MAGIIGYPITRLVTGESPMRPLGSIRRMAVLPQSFFEGKAKYIFTTFGIKKYAHLKENAEKLESGEYIADVGFCWRRDAGGGGSALDPKTLKAMGRANISLWLSEYASFSDENE